MKAIVHITASTFDGREAFTAGAYAGTDPEEALHLTRNIHQVGGIPWATVKGQRIDPREIDIETMVLLHVEEETA